MYSPKISEDLIPALYHTAKAKHIPMTKLVRDLILKALASEELPENALSCLVPCRDASTVLNKHGVL